MTLEELHDHIEAVVDYNSNEFEDARDNGLEGHVANHLLALSEFIGDPVTEVCPSCEDQRPFETTFAGGVCPHCGHVEPEEDD